MLHFNPTSSLRDCIKTQIMLSMKTKALALFQESEVASEELIGHELKQMQSENIQHVSVGTEAVHGGHHPPSAHLEGRKTERAVSE